MDTNQVTSLCSWWILASSWFANWSSNYSLATNFHALLRQLVEVHGEQKAFLLPVKAAKRLETAELWGQPAPKAQLFQAQNSWICSCGSAVSNLNSWAVGATCSDVWGMNFINLVQFVCNPSEFMVRFVVCCQSQTKLHFCGSCPSLVVSPIRDYSVPTGRTSSKRHEALPLLICCSWQSY